MTNKQLDMLFDRFISRLRVADTEDVALFEISRK